MPTRTSAGRISPGADRGVTVVIPLMSVLLRASPALGGRRSPGLVTPRSSLAVAQRTIQPVKRLILHSECEAVGHVVETAAETVPHPRFLVDSGDLFHSFLHAKRREQAIL